MATKVFPGGSGVTRVFPAEAGGGGTISSSDIGIVDVLWKTGGSTSGTGAWGTVGTPVTDFIIIRYDSATGSSGFVKIQGSGDDSAFYLMSIEGDDIDTPQTFLAITNDSDHLYIAWKGTVSGGYRQIEVGIKPIYVDATAKTLSLDFFDHEGSSVGTLSASATVSDPFQNAVEAPGIGTVLGLWSAQDTAAGSIASGDTSFRNIYSSAPFADDLKAYANGARNPPTSDAVASFTPTAKSSGFSNGSLSGEVYVDLAAAAAVKLHSKTYWYKVPGTIALDSLGTNDQGAITSDMLAWFMVVKNNSWTSQNNLSASNNYVWAGGPGLGTYSPLNTNTTERWMVTLQSEKPGGSGYGRAGLMNQAWYASYTAVGVASNAWLTISVMQNPSNITQYKWWLSEVGQPFGGLHTPSVWWASGNPTDKRTWGVWPYGQWSNTVDTTRLSAAAVAAWDVGWDESATGYFQTMHNSVT